MNRNELLEFKQEAEEALVKEKICRACVRRAYQIIQELCLEMKTEPPGGPGWVMLDERMEDFTRMYSLYIDGMKYNIEKYHMFPKLCAAIQQHIDNMEEIHRKIVDKWLDMKRSLPPEQAASEDMEEF